MCQVRGERGGEGGGGGGGGGGGDVCPDDAATTICIHMRKCVCVCVSVPGLPTFQFQIS